MIHTSAPISIINANVTMHRNIIKNKKEKKNKNLNDKDVFFYKKCLNKLGNNKNNVYLIWK
jgi:hypothetical protein